MAAYFAQTTAEMSADARLTSSDDEQGQKLEDTDSTSEEQSSEAKSRKNKSLIAGGAVVACVPACYLAAKSLFIRNQQLRANSSQR